jgi:hypothetical protein
VGGGFIGSNNGVIFPLVYESRLAGDDTWMVKGVSALDPWSLQAFVICTSA